jgi:N-carbamoylputrescine amidase
VYICYDRHFPEGWRALALAGAEYIVNPAATAVSVSQHQWEIVQPAAALANGCYVASVNRVGTEAPWNVGRFYGSSYVANPRGKIIAQASDANDELLVVDMDWDVLHEARNALQLFRDRRPETYGSLLGPYAQERGR